MCGSDVGSRAARLPGRRLKRGSDLHGAGDAGAGPPGAGSRNYSYELDEPYYILTDAGVQVTERVTGHWDLVGRAARQWLNYQQLVSSGLSSREDHGWHLGMGTGWWVGTAMRVGVDADYVTRDSPVPFRSYSGWRVGGNLTYGPQNP